MLASLGAAGTVGLAGCFQNGGGDGDGGRELRLGILMGVSGGLAQLGPPIRQAAELPVSRINDANVDLSATSQFEDTATDPNQGISGGNALVSAGYPMIAGALASSVTLQVAENVAIPNEVVLTTPATTSPEVTTLADNDFVWRTTPSDILQGGLLTQIARERLEVDTASTLFLNNAYGQGLSGSFEEAFENAGGTVTASVSFEGGQSSYTSRLNSALADDPDTMLIVGYPASGVQIFRDFYADYSADAVDILVADGFRDPDLPGDVGNDLSNVIGTAPVTAGPGREAFNSQYQDAYGSEPGVFTGQAYDAAAVMLLANAAAGVNSAPAVRDEMRNVANPGGTVVTPANLVEGIEMAAAGDEVQYQGAAGDLEFDENGDVREAVYEVFEFGADGLTTIDEVEFSSD